MLGVGDHVPAARVWLDPRETVALDALASDGPFLLLFFLFAWSST